MADATTRRKRPGGYDPEQMRLSLLEAAVKLFREKGYADASVHEIATTAGATKGALYHHFKSKEHLLRELHDQFVDYELASIRAVVAEHDEPSEQLRLLLHEFMHSVETYLDSMTVYFQERRHLTGEHQEAVLRKREEFDNLFLGVIERGMAVGSFRADLDPRIVAFGILGMLSWVHQWFSPEGRRSTDEIAEIFAGMVLAGIAA